MQRINKMLLEMASGNFFYRLERSTKKDNLESLVISLNILAEEIQETLLHQGYANSNDTILETIQMSFILDVKGQIQMVNKQACNILSALHTDIIGTHFTEFLVQPSLEKWQGFWKTLMQKNIYDSAIELIFKTKGNLVIPKTCHITTFKDENYDKRKVLITVIHHSYRKENIERDLKQSVIEFSKTQKKALDHNDVKPKLRLSFEDIRKIRKGHDIIINNLEKELPSLKDFALQLGTNEFKLKYGFKELYGTSVHRFLMSERMRKSKMLIQFTDQSIKSIAHMTGFKSISHFSRTFKKHYEYTPSDLRKKSLNRDK